MHKKVVAVDFDGVLHCFDGQWAGVDVINQGPVAGAIPWLQAMLADGRFDVVIYSARNCDLAGVAAMQAWLMGWGLTSDEVEALSFPSDKPAASLFIDDRAFSFCGLFPLPDEVADFKPWWKQVG
jgi:hypothetical protein